MEKPANAKRELRSSKKKLTNLKEAASPNIKKSKSVLLREVLVSDASEKRKQKPNVRYVGNPISHEITPKPGVTIVEAERTEIAAPVVTTAKGSNGPKKPTNKKRKAKKVRYEVNCSDIKDLDMVDFQTYLRSDIKVAGKKNSPYLKVNTHGLKIIIKSKVFVAKKSVRFSARKYFKNKKNHSVRVVNESSNSYKLSVKM